ncbi:hypothetical protein CSHISOI_05626 [Colletotrichum shisoi]|uniref:Aspercryptin biosynthesis cluster-specific transcription regulator atnN n=1 Tax=Colletotrichum shisoi TaxID=2078593 RepID=A0A5Q4BSI9_9PEZI|nr:hypothetical protein CSHISOI_05626 [Colletotrichum shisoi]
MNNGSSLATRLALSQRPQLTRASRPKVRTGCITCKPACATCLTYQGYCGGYAANKKQTLDRNRPIHPKPARSQTKHDLLLEPNHASLVFSGQLEKDHFDYWLAFTETTVLFRSDLLTQVIPQLSWTDPAIKHAALAIGASALGRNTREQRLLGTGEQNPAALKHYSKALSLLYTSPMSPEKTLLACLLFIIFECLRGNSTAGLSHINHGFQVLDQHQHSQSNKLSPLLLNEVITRFQRFGQQAWALNGIHPRETHERVPWCCRGVRRRYAVEEMPIVFETLETARYWWDIVRHHVEHHAPFYTNFQVKGSSPRAAQRPPEGYGSSESSARHVRSFVRYLDAWNTAFLPLAITAESRKGTCLADYLKALSLRIHYLYLWAGVRSVGWTDAEEAKRILPTFCDIVALSRQLLAAQAARQRSMIDGEVFALEDSPTWPLACTYRVCTEPKVRTDIVRLFKEYPRRDGLLDTHAFLVMMEWMAKAASAGVITNDQSPVDDCIVFRDNTVVLHKRLWDPKGARWNDRSITLSIR